VIDKLLNYPNPFWDQTEFIFEHNQASSKNNIRIEIFDLMGKKMTELNAVDNSGSFKIAPIVWDGTGSDGAKLARGMYIYKVQLTNSLGAKTSKSSKLMIIK
jgi:flagellar hook assembly protein FlgD